MSDAYLHLTQIAQQCGRVLNIADWQYLDFDTIFNEIQAISDNADADDLLVHLFNYAGAYGGFAHLDRVYRLKGNAVTEAEQHQYEQFRDRSIEVRQQIIAKLHQIEQDQQVA